MRAFSSGPNHLPKVPPLNTDTLDFGFQHINFGGTQHSDYRICLTSFSAMFASTLLGFCRYCQFLSVFTNLFPTKMQENSSCSTSLPTLDVVSSFNVTYFGILVVVFHCAFHMHVLITTIIKSFFLFPSWTFECLLLYLFRSFVGPKETRRLQLVTHPPVAPPQCLSFMTLPLLQSFSQLFGRISLNSILSDVSALTFRC